MIKRVLYIVNLVFVLLLLGVYVGVRVSPEIFAELSLLSYIYPLLLIVNVLFCLFWLLFKWRYILVPLASILIGIDFPTRFFGTNFEEDSLSETSLKIMTYNVKYFSEGVQEDRTIRQRNKDSILSVIESYAPDIVCLQEYASTKKAKDCFHYILTKQLGYKYFFAPYNYKDYVRGSVIYSKYEISTSGVLFPMDKEFYQKTYADINFGDKKLRVYNVHLDSYMLSEEEKYEVDNIKTGQITSEQTNKSVLAKLLETNKEQAKEVRELSSVIEQTEGNFVLVGDFNATPYSYTYQVLTKELKDSFVEKGKGFSGTYNYFAPKFRIDYVLVSEQINVEGYQQEVFDYSDHNPVVVDFKFD
jgi:endonuclease/exonuclease/phosphatase family metal-dependent hydrolase